MFSLPSHRHRRSGFTLVELLIVLGILVMIMAFAAPRLLRSGEKAKIQKARVDIAGFKEVLKLYYLDMSSFPTTEQGLDALYERPSDEDEDGKWDGPYGDGDEPPRDPWGNEYQYEWPATHGDDAGDREDSGREYPDIWSLGKDGEDGTDDDICNWKKDGGGGEGEEGAGDMPEIDLGGEGDL